MSHTIKAAQLRRPGAAWGRLAGRQAGRGKQDEGGRRRRRRRRSKEGAVGASNQKKWRPHCRCGTKCQQTLCTTSTLRAQPVSPCFATLKSRSSLLCARLGVFARGTLVVGAPREMAAQLTLGAFLSRQRARQAVAPGKYMAPKAPGKWKIPLPSAKNPVPRYQD
eukprot:gene9581-biopygen7696